MKPAKPQGRVAWPAGASFSPFLVLGYGCYWAWTRLAFESAVFLPRDNAFELASAAFVVSAVANVLTVLLCMIMERRLGQLGRRPGTVVVLSALAVLGSIGTVVAPGLGGLAESALVVGSVLTGIGTGFLVLFLGQSFGSLNPREAALNTSFSWIFAVVVYQAIVHLPSLLGVSIAVALPLLSGAAVLRATQGTLEATSSESEPLRLRWFPRGVKIATGALFLYSVAFLVMSTVFKSGGIDAIAQFGQYSLLGGGIVAVLLATSTLLFPRKMMGFTYRAVLPVTLAGLLLIPVLGASQSTSAMAVLGAGHVYLFIVTWILLSEVAYRLGLPAIRVFGVAQVMFVGAVIVSVPAGQLLSEYAALGDRQWVALPIVLALLLATTAMLTLNEDQILGGWGLADAIEEPAEGTRRDAGPWMKKCKATAEEHGLSARETEVMIMLAKGRSLPHIQETLHIASGTAHTHARHIYAKLDIHSRQELLDLIEHRTSKTP